MTAEIGLDAARFVRVHRPALWTFDHVIAFRRREGGQLVAELDDDSVAPVSRERTSAATCRRLISRPGLRLTLWEPPFSCDIGGAAPLPPHP
ncbi:hypothetical protein BH11GEM2_BH11GEM2_03140 [soil metagenome]